MLILAPMAGFSDQPFRRLCREFGADEVVTELVSANALVRDNKKTFDMIRIHEDERPASVQIFGSEPDIMAEAAKKVETVNPKYIDINMGCPARKIVKNGGGAALLENPKLAALIVKKVVNAVRVPVSIKIRTGKNAENKTGMETARRAADSGASRITVHARTVSDGFSGPIDLKFVKDLKNSVEVEIIGNGGIDSCEDARRWLEESGCDGLMIGRGAVGRPSLFGAISAGTEPPDSEDTDTVLRHCEWMEEYYGPEQAVGPMRGHLMYYSRGISTARSFRREVNNAASFDELKEIVKGKFRSNIENIV
ncbi:MAG: tRNA dihydrouridine synthase DusB [Nitrospinota bacterium]